MVNPVIVALDFEGLDDAMSLARQLRESVGGFKVGLELLMGEGPSAVETVADLGLPVFADTKLHDIPNTVGRAARQIREAGARWLTVHAAGGSEMVAAATESMGNRGVLAVTVLTSMDLDLLRSVGVELSVEDQVMTLVGVAMEGGAEGIVCSPREIVAVKEAAPQLKVFTPGIRPTGSDAHDQRRIMSPEKARSNGADYLVVGRAITGADDPLQAAEAIVASVSGAT